VLAVTLSLAGSAGADTAVLCAARPEPIRDHAARLAEAVSATDAMVGTLDIQIAALEERLTSGANASQDYALLETTLNLREEIAAQQAETEALLVMLCQPDETK